MAFLPPWSLLGSQGPAALVWAVLGLAFAVGGALVWPTHRWVAVCILGVGAYLGAGAWLIGCGRVGDGAVILTQERISQRHSGVEESVPWSEVDNVRLTGLVFEFHARTGLERSQHAPRLWTRAKPRPSDTMSLLLVDQHPDVEVFGAVMRWVEDDFARHEIGTPEAVQKILVPR